MPVLRRESQFSWGLDRILKDKAIINYRKTAKHTPEKKFNHSVLCGSAISDVYVHAYVCV